MKYLDKNKNPFFITGKQKAFVWDDTRAFLALARYGTLTSASESLNIGITTLSRRIDRLEAALSTPLFIRLQSGYQLTEDGIGLVEKAEVIEQAVLSLLSIGLNTCSLLSGKVRLATAENLATEIIIPALSEFQANYPELMIELITDTQLANLHRRDADLAIRMVRPTQGNVTFRHLGKLGFGLYSQRPLGKNILNEQSHFIMWDEQHRHLPGTQWLEAKLNGNLPRLTVTSLASMLAATQAGLGHAILPHFIAKKAGLSCIESNVGVEQPIYLVVQADIAQSQRVRAVADFLVNVINMNKKWLEHGDNPISLAHGR
ncbi:LysR family transcriptional regulator [Shewanella sp. VB17]|uniref:LysR family transcriptional regulator n=1 Tax=Shewanella sp. VB17 TaxID=2739432 RepID=UPI0015634886|nr:LysR family transcriptional regulator [Shewanella sp. VB17]NRD71877.1 LysR family transcriptional regulator [Shewanella sp. VB17]